MLDVIAIGPHPDDVELSMGGTLLALKAQGYRTGIIDLTNDVLSVSVYLVLSIAIVN